MELSLHNKNFYFFLLLHFPFASNDDLEMMLDEYMFENFETPSCEWFDELTGLLDENKEEIEPWNGLTYVHKLNTHVTLYDEFHPLETVYFFNDTFLGNSGGNFQLSLFSWDEFQAIIRHEAQHDASLLFLLLLPLVIGTKSKRVEIEAKIQEELQKSVLQLSDEHVSHLTAFLTHHLIFDDDDKNQLIYHKDIGLVTKRNHSQRNEHHDKTDLIAINEIIALATQKGV